MKQDLFSDFKLSKYIAPLPLMYKYITQTIYLSSIMSLVFVFSRAKLEKNNDETGLFSSFTHSVNLSEWRIIHKYQNLFPHENKKKSNKILKFGNPLLFNCICQRGGYLPRGVLSTRSILRGCYFPGGWGVFSTG